MSASYGEMTGIFIEPIIEYTGCDFGTKTRAILPMQKTLDGSTDFNIVKHLRPRFLIKIK